MGESQKIVNRDHIAQVTHGLEHVSLLITHYNRSRSLEQLLQSMSSLNIWFKSVVVSDDGSGKEHIDYIRDLKRRYNFKLCTTPINKGLGNNINKGQDVVDTEYTLYIQEDFVPTKYFKERLIQGVQLLEDHQDYDMVRFYSYLKYPYLIPYKYGFSKMVFKWWYPGLVKFAYYSDHPHLRRSSFTSKFGRYREGISGDQTEFSMMISFIQMKGKAFFYDDYKALLDQVNSSEEPSTMHRNYWRNSNNFFVSILRVIYRYAKSYFSYFFIKYKN